MNKSFLAFLCLLPTLHLSGQNLELEVEKFMHGKRPMALSNYFGGDSRIAEEHEILLAVPFDQLDENMHWSYYLDLSVQRFYLKKDSVMHYFRKAYEAKNYATCSLIYHKLDFLEQLTERGDPPPSDYHWYFTDLSQEDQNEIHSICKGYEEGVVKKEPVPQTLVGISIMERDQKYRQKKPVNWELQNALDEDNRKFLDSLYNITHSFESFSEYDLDAFSFVLHHSNDCTWNKKWFKIWLAEIDKEEFKGGNLFGEAFKRMMEPDKGVCWQRNPENSRIFIDFIKSKYPKFYTQFSYWKL